MQKKIKKIKNPYLLFLPILLGIVIVFLLDWVTGPHLGATHPPLEYCGHTRASARIGSIPHFHCTGDEYPLMYALFRYLGFLCFMTISFAIDLGMLIIPFVVFGYVSKRTKNNFIAITTYIIILAIELYLLLKLAHIF